MTIAELTLFLRMTLAARSRREHEERDAKRESSPLNWLRSFESAARLMSFTLAAEELHMTQGAVSQHIRSLEAHLKSHLFIRLARRIELTEEGLAYLTIVQASIQHLEIATNEIFGEGHRKQIKVKGSIAFSPTGLTPVV